MFYGIGIVAGTDHQAKHNMKETSVWHLLEVNFKARGLTTSHTVTLTLKLRTKLRRLLPPLDTSDSSSFFSRLFCHQGTKIRGLRFELDKKRKSPSDGRNTHGGGHRGIVPGTN
jgi:hypothetical protein